MARAWYAFYPGDYEKKTAGLTLVQHGAYRRLMDHYYMTGEPLPANAEILMRVCRAFADDERAAIDFILGEFFVHGDDGWHHIRIDEEISKAADISKKRGIAGKIGAKTTNTKQPTKKRQLPTQSQSQSHTTPISPKGDDGFDEFYEAYPRHEGRGQARRAYRGALDKASAPLLLAAAKRFARARENQDQKFTPLPATWLNGERWADQPISIVGAIVFENTDERGWRDRMRVFRDKGGWSPKWGPRPDESGCKCPAEILEKPDTEAAA